MRQTTRVTDHHRPSTPPLRGIRRTLSFGPIAGRALPLPEQFPCTTSLLKLPAKVLHCAGGHRG